MQTSARVALSWRGVDGKRHRLERRRQRYLATCGSSVEPNADRRLATLSAYCKTRDIGRIWASFSLKLSLELFPGVN